MAVPQVASRFTHFFGVKGSGNPTNDNVVLLLRTNDRSEGVHACKVYAHDGDVIITVQKSNDGVNFTNDANVTNLAIPAKVAKDFTILTRRDMDTHVRIIGTGEGKCEFQTEGGFLSIPVTPQ